MRILLLGSTGLLGQNVLRRLLGCGHQVVALVRSCSVALLPNHDQLFVRQGSLLDFSDLMGAAQCCNAIVNCAGTTDMALLRLEDYLPVNCDLCRLLLQVMEKCGIKRLVHVSTANTIGYGSAFPATEGEPMQEPFAHSLYAISKSRGEEVLMTYAQQHLDNHIVVVNPGFIVGAYDHKPSSGQLLLAAYRRRLMLVPSGGKSFVAATACAVAIESALTRGINGRRYLLTGQNLTLRKFYALQATQRHYRQYIVTIPSWLMLLAGFIGDVIRLFHIPTQLSSNNIRQLLATEHYDSSAAQSELALPCVPIHEAIDAFFEWYDA